METKWKEKRDWNYINIKEYDTFEIDFDKAYSKWCRQKKLERILKTDTEVCSELYDCLVRLCRSRLKERKLVERNLFGICDKAYEKFKNYLMFRIILGDEIDRYYKL